MKIAINTSCAVAGGAITHLRRLLPELVSRLGSDDIVVIGDAQTREKIQPPSGLEWLETDPIRGGLLGRLWFENITLRGILESLGADVLFHPANFAAFRSPIPQVILIHNLAPFLPAVTSGESFGQKIRLGILHALTLKSLSVAARTIFISGWGRTQVIPDAAADDARMPVIAFGSEHGAKSSDPSVLSRFGLEKDQFILTVSHLYRYKKIEKLIDSVPLLRGRGIDLPIVIVGEPYDEEYSARMRARAEESGGRILFTGGLPAPALAALMLECRQFVFTSEAENLPITLLEAMACGCAIVTNRACSMPEVCADAVLYADPACAQTYADAIETLESDSEARSSLRRAAIERASDFSWPKNGVETLAVLRSAVEADR
jgi:glycosyltransferase involved in cell wall biosynthesis